MRSLNIFSRLAKRTSIHAVSFADPVADAASIREMQRLFETYTPVFWRETKKYSPRFYKEIIANQFNRLPYFLAKCRHPHFRSTVEDLLAKEHFDILFSDFLQPLEARVFRSFDHILTVSEEDQQTIRYEFGIDHVSTIPTGVDTDFFCPSGNDSQPGRLAFVGSMDWDPNEDGVVWFLESIFGGGTRIKIPEAMAMGKAVVSTPIGAEGLHFHNNHEICLAEHPEDFARIVITLLSQHGLRDAIGTAARAAVASKHKWEAAVDQIEECLNDVIGKEKPRASRDLELQTQRVCV